MKAPSFTLPLAPKITKHKNYYHPPAQCLHATKSYNRVKQERTSPAVTLIVSGYSHTHRTMDSTSCDNEKLITTHIVAGSTSERAMLKDRKTTGLYRYRARGAKGRHTDMSVCVTLRGRPINVTFIVLQLVLAHHLMGHT